MAALDEVETVVNAYVIPVICVFGIVCNILNLIVLTRKQLKESPYTYLTGLAVTDLGVLTLSFLHSTFSNGYGKEIYGWKIYDAKIFLPIANMLANSSVWVTVLLTFERFVSVKYPLKAREYCTKQIARRAMAVTYFIALLINIPRFFSLDVLVKDDGKAKLMPTEFAKSQHFHYINWFYVVLIHAIPLLTLGVLNVYLIVAVKKAGKRRQTIGWRSHYNKHSKEQMRLTVTCISIIICFLICITPSAFANKPVAVALFAQGMTFSEFYHSSFYRALKVCANMLVYCNLSLNFVLYCFFNHKFLKTLKSLCCDWLSGALKYTMGREVSFHSRTSSGSIDAVAKNGIWQLNNSEGTVVPCSSTEGTVLLTTIPPDVVPATGTEDVSLIVAKTAV